MHKSQIDFQAFEIKGIFSLQNVKSQRKEYLFSQNVIKKSIKKFNISK